MKTPVVALLWGAAALFVCGLIVGFMPLSSAGQSCGSAFHGASVFLAPPTCADVRSMPRIFAVVLIVLSVGALIAAGSLHDRYTVSDPSRRSAPDAPESDRP